ncbi:hypothetical protein BaRGS_00011397 [Batillaria attramentaria]|uniref:Fibronectin type III-like domain-containing protein n=1 Tax=Batillaria attramentaria TaxID=370345 RepID=A0ABD0LDE7_9CAEN
MEADEVVQVYIQWTNSTLPAPQLQLAWFTRITMAARQTNLQVPFQIEGQTMALWVNDSWRIAAGTMNLYAGGQQPTQARAVPSNVIGGQFQIIGSKILGRF